MQKDVLSALRLGGCKDISGTGRRFPPFIREQGDVMKKQSAAHETLRWSGTIAVILVAIGALSAIYLYARHGMTIASWLAGREVTTEGSLGAWGDSFGALNVVVSSLAFVGIVITLLLQGRGLKIQGADQHRQRFDASFFELLRLQRETRREILFFNTQEYETERAAQSYQTFSLATTGRIPSEGTIDPIAAAVLEIHFQLIRKGILSNCSRNDVVNAYMRYVHSASEATIAPYFRVIYSILDRIRADQILTPAEKIRYANLLRGQLTSAEVLLLGINSLTPVSADMKSLVAEFRMLKYLPKSSMRALLGRFHEPISFAGRQDRLPPRKIKFTAFNDKRYRNMIAALHAERKIRKISRRKLAEKLGKPEKFVSDYEDGRSTLGVPDFVDVARALGSHPAVFLRH